MKLGLLTSRERFVTVGNDHQPLEQIHKKNLHKAPTRVRLLLQLQGYNFTHRDMMLADTLSRLSANDKFAMKDMGIKIHHIQTSNKLEQIRDQTSKDQKLQILSQQKMTPDTTCNMTNSLGNDVLLGGSHLLISKTLQPEIFQKMHQCHTGPGNENLEASKNY